LKRRWSIFSTLVFDSRVDEGLAKALLVIASAAGHDHRPNAVDRVCQLPEKEGSHRGPGAASASRTLMGADIEARLAVEAECGAAQWQM